MQKHTHADAAWKPNLSLRNRNFSSLNLENLSGYAHLSMYAHLEFQLQNICEARHGCSKSIMFTEKYLERSFCDLNGNELWRKKFLKSCDNLSYEPSWVVSGQESWDQTVNFLSTLEGWAPTRSFFFLVTTSWNYFSFAYSQQEVY